MTLPDPAPAQAAGLHTLVRLPAEGAPTLLYLLFHGHGQDEHAMAPMAEVLAAEYPQAAVVCLRAPNPADALPGQVAATGYQYFSRLELTDENRIARVQAQLPVFVAQVRALQRHFDMPWTHTALVGFSQGGIVSLDAVQVEPHLAGRVLAFGARHVLPLEHAPEDTTVHLFHGTRDQVIPYAFPVESAERLITLGGDVTADIVPGVRHEMDPRLIEKALGQLRTFLPQRVWRDAVAEAPEAMRPKALRRPEN